MAIVKRFKEGLMKDIKILLKKKKTRRENMAVNAIKISQKMTTKNYLSKEKDVIKCEEITERSLKELSIYKKNFMASFYGWGSTASRLQPLRGGSLLFTTKFPEIPGTHFIDFGRMKG